MTIQQANLKLVEMLEWVMGADNAFGKMIDNQKSVDILDAMVARSRKARNN